MSKAYVMMNCKLGEESRDHRMEGCKRGKKVVIESIKRYKETLKKY